MVQEVKLGSIPLSDYEHIITKESFSQIKKLAKNLAGLRVIHLNTSSTGGGVSEVLHSLVPLQKGVGLNASWYMSRRHPSFFKITKQIHNFLQGKKGDLEEEERELYLQVNKDVAQSLSSMKADVWIIHDPQFAATIEYHERPHPAIWRCHIDTSHPNLFVWRFLLPFIKKYDRYIFTMRKYLGPDLDYKKAAIFPPAIDPLNKKNNALDKPTSDEIISRYKVNPAKPLISQISRFDPWKDPWGVIDAYRLAKKEFPDLQLALIGAFAPDDPEAKAVAENLEKYARGDENIFILSNHDGIGNVEVNGFQVASDIVIQKSTREGFGLTVSEAMWKATPVIGGKAGGIVEQIVDGETGFLVTTAAQTAEKITYLLKHPEEAAKMGEKGRERVRHRFLITELLLDHLKLYDELV